MTDADSLATPDRQDRIDYIYYQGKSLQAVSSQCYDNLLGSPFLFEGKKILLWIRSWICFDQFSSR